ALLAGTPPPAGSGSPAGPDAPLGFRRRAAASPACLRGSRRDRETRRAPTRPGRGTHRAPDRKRRACPASRGSRRPTAQIGTPTGAPLALAIRRRSRQDPPLGPSARRL